MPKLPTDRPIAPNRSPHPAIRDSYAASGATYQRLLTGEAVSWLQLVREHQLLGTMTVAQLINAGKVRVTPMYDPRTDQGDFVLRLANELRPDLAAPMESNARGAGSGRVVPLRRRRHGEIARSERRVAPAGMRGLRPGGERNGNADGSPARRPAHLAVVSRQKGDACAMTERAGSPPRTPHVAVLNDSHEILGLMREIFEEEGYRVSTFPEPLGPEALRQLRPDLIIQDLPAGQAAPDGWRFLHEARQDPETSRIPLILCTTAAHVVNDERTADELQRLGVRVVTMPFDLDEMLGVMSEALTERIGDPAPPA